MKTFQEAFVKRIKDAPFSLNKLARETGVSYEQLKKLNQGKAKTTNVDDAIKIADFFGMDLTQFINGEEETAQIRVIQIVNSLSPEALSTLEAVAKAQLVSQQNQTEKSQKDEK